MDNEKLCVNCMNCRIKNEMVFCSTGEFKSKTLEEVMLYVPEDFDCEYFESDEEDE